MPNIVKELRKAATLNAAKALAQANSILESDKDADMQMLKYFGRAQEVSNAHSQQATANKIMQSGNIVSISDVKNVCFKYALRYTLAKHYRKTIPAHALNDLRKFKEAHPGMRPDGLNVIAPASHFHTVDAPKKDPVLVYEHSKENIEIISTWGNDFSVMRRLIGIWALAWYYIIPALALTSSITLVCRMSETSNPLYCVLSIAFAIVSVFASIIIIISGSLGCWPDGSDLDNFKVKWNTNHK